MSAAAGMARRSKAAHPERYCPVPSCLWRTGGSYCPRHGGSPPKKETK